MIILITVKLLLICSILKRLIMETCNLLASFHNSRRQDSCCLYFDLEWTCRPCRNAFLKNKQQIQNPSIAMRTHNYPPGSGHPAHHFVWHGQWWMCLQEQNMLNVGGRRKSSTTVDPVYNEKGHGPQVLQGALHVITPEAWLRGLWLPALCYAHRA